MVKVITINSFQQGYAKNTNTSEYAVKTPVLRMNPTNSVIVSFQKTTEKNVQFALVGYSDPDTENLVCELTWYTDNPKTFDLSSRFEAKYWVVVFTNIDGSKIFPSDMSYVTINIKNLTEVEGYILSIGSLAYVVETGEIYAIKSDGVWRTTNGEAIS